METAAAAAAAAARGASLRMPSMQSPAARKEWRVVSEQSVASAANEDLDGSKLGHSDERTIYEGLESCDIGFCSIQIDGVGDLDDDFEKKLHDFTSRREEFQQMEIELRARMIARSEIVAMQKRFDAQIKEQANVTAKLQDQLKDRDERIMELERKMEDKERELHAIRLDNEKAWAKEGLLREQNMELANFRREHDNIEAERAHHIKQIHDLQEHIQDKERQTMELQEQHRIAQETLLYKDEQLREAQVWIARAQEMDALRSNTNHTLQAELRERTEQYNQLWLGCQRQFAEMERLHMQTVQQLQLELAGAREKTGIYNDNSCISNPSSNEITQFGQEANESGTSSRNSVNLPNGNPENSQLFASSGSASAQVSHVGLAITSQSLFGAASYLPPGQVHPYATHQQGANHPLPTLVPPPHAGHFPSMPAIPSYQHWQVQQAVSEGVQGSMQSPHELSQIENNLMRPDSNYSYKIAMNGQDLSPDYLNVHLSQAMEANSVTSSSECVQVLASVDKGCVASEGQPILQQISLQFHDALRLAPLDQSPDIKENDAIGSNDGLETRVMATEPSDSAATLSPSVKPAGVVSSTEVTISTATDAALPEAFVSLGQRNSLPIGKMSETALLDERSLLSCIVRTIPAGGKIRISSTLPNRLGKMLAPLHWHDYKKKYGKLDDFVASHPELFVIEGDYIQLREGAQGMIAATAAVAKVAAAVAATPPYSCVFPSVAVTPMAQANRLNKVPSIDSKVIASAADGSLLLSSIQSQHSNGAGGLPNLQILSKSRDTLDISIPTCQSGPSSILDIAENGSSSDRSGFSNFQGIVQFNGRPGTNFISKQEGRDPAVQLVPRR